MNNIKIQNSKYTEESRKILSEKAMGNKSAAGRKTKNYLFIDPNGKKYKIDRNFNDFCKEHDLAKRSVTRHLKSQRSIETYKGWQIFKLD